MYGAHGKLKTQELQHLQETQQPVAYEQELRIQTLKLTQTPELEEPEPNKPNKQHVKTGTTNHISRQPLPDAAPIWEDLHLAQLPNWQLIWKCMYPSCKNYPQKTKQSHKT